MVSKKPTQTLKHKRLYSVWVTTLQNIMDKVTHKVWDMKKVGGKFNGGLWGKHLKTRPLYIVYGDS